MPCHGILRLKALCYDPGLFTPVQICSERVPYQLAESPEVEHQTDIVSVALQRRRANIHHVRDVLFTFPHEGECQDQMLP